MPDTNAFADFLRRVRQGDAGATDELWRRFEPLLRREVRLRLRDSRLRRLFDETDVCQSVMASFFVRAAAGQFDLDGPEQLQRLLVQMGRNKLATQARRHQAERRDCRRVEQFPTGDGEVAGSGSSPSQIVAWQELLVKFRDRLSAEERQVADLRHQGQSWEEVAAALGGSAIARRVQLHRAIARVSRELGLDETDDE